jgi:hypothetical protein
LQYFAMLRKYISAKCGELAGNIYFKALSAKSKAHFQS